MMDYLKEILAEENPEALFMDGFEEAIVGFAQRHTEPPLVIYDRRTCIEILMREMSEEEAEEYFSFNCENAWAGKGTPLILYRGL